MLNSGADPNIPNSLGQIPLHSACESGNTAMVELLLSHNSDCNYQSSTGDSPLHHAAGRGDSLVLRLLLEHGAIPNLTNKVSFTQMGRTALHLVSEIKSINCMQVLQDYGADPDITDNDWKRPLDLNSDFRASEDQDAKAVYLTSKSEDVSELDSSPQIYDLFNTFGGLNPATKDGKRPEKILLLEWLNDNNLTELYDALLDSGYDDHIVMARQMLSTMPIKRKNLAEIGIPRPGHQRRLLFCLEEEGKKRSLGKNKNFKNKRERESLVGWTGNEVLGVLTELRMEGYMKNFVEAGYDDYDCIVQMHGSKWGLNEFILKTELRIYDMHEAQRLMARIQKDSVQGKTEQSIIFEEPKNIACSRCEVM